ncbi:MAG: hypothetical protein H6698_06810 [Myxococcales bacterium]|nr:hypothetical protein [Myxococcales bacterium]
MPPEIAALCAVTTAERLAAELALAESERAVALVAAALPTSSGPLRMSLLRVALRLASAELFDAVAAVAVERTSDDEIAAALRALVVGPEPTDARVHAVLKVGATSASPFARAAAYSAALRSRRSLLERWGSRAFDDADEIVRTEAAYAFREALPLDAADAALRRLRAIASGPVETNGVRTEAARLLAGLRALGRLPPRSEPVADAGEPAADAGGPSRVAAGETVALDESVVPGEQSSRGNAEGDDLHAVARLGPSVGARAVDGAGGRAEEGAAAGGGRHRDADLVQLLPEPPRLLREEAAALSRALHDSGAPARVQVSPVEPS